MPGQQFRRSHPQVSVEQAADFGNALRVNPPPAPQYRTPVSNIVPPPEPQRFSLKGCFFVSLAVLVIVAAAISFSLGLNDQRLRPPRLSSAVWTAHADGQPRLYFVMEEERSQRRTRGRVYSYSVTYSLFTLRSRDARTGAVTGEEELARIDNAGDGPGIIGPQGNVLWMWDDGLIGMSLSTLKPVWSVEKLKQLNPELGAFLPVDRKYYKVLEKFNMLTYKGADARYFQVDDATGKIQVLDDAALASHDNNGRAEQAFHDLRTPGQPMRSTSVSGLIRSSLTDDDKWYALLADEDRKKLSKSPGNGYYPSGEEARKLYRGDFTWEDRLGTKEVLLDLESVVPVNGERYLMGGFLVRQGTEGPWGTATLWRPAGGNDALVLHKKLLGVNSPWHLTRLKLDGTAAWNCSIGLADLTSVSDAQDTLVFTGFADMSEPTNNRPELFVMIDEKTGGTRTVNLQE